MPLIAQPGLATVAEQPSPAQRMLLRIAQAAVGRPVVVHAQTSQVDVFTPFRFHLSYWHDVVAGLQLCGATYPVQFACHPLHYGACSAQH